MYGIICEIWIISIVKWPKMYETSLKLQPQHLRFFSANHLVPCLPSFKLATLRAVNNCLAMTALLQALSHPTMRASLNAMLELRPCCKTHVCFTLEVSLFLRTPRLHISTEMLQGELGIFRDTVAFCMLRQWCSTARPAWCLSDHRGLVHT